MRSAVDEDRVPIVEAKEAEASSKAPEILDSTVSIVFAREAEASSKAPETFDSTVSILVCNEPVAVFNAVVVASSLLI